MLEQIYNLLPAKGGIRINDLADKLGYSYDEIRPWLKAMIREEIATTEGQRAGTKYLRTKKKFKNIELHPPEVVDLVVEAVQEKEGITQKELMEIVDDYKQLPELLVYLARTNRLCVEGIKPKKYYPPSRVRQEKGATPLSLPRPKPSTAERLVKKIYNVLTGWPEATAEQILGDLEEDITLGKLKKVLGELVSAGKLVTVGKNQYDIPADLRAPWTAKASNTVLEGEDTDEEEEEEEGEPLENEEDEESDEEEEAQESVTVTPSRRPQIVRKSFQPPAKLPAGLVDPDTDLRIKLIRLRGLTNFYPQDAGRLDTHTKARFADWMISQPPEFLEDLADVLGYLSQHGQEAIMLSVMLHKTATTKTKLQESA